MKQKRERERLASFFTLKPNVRNMHRKLILSNISRLMCVLALMFAWSSCQSLIYDDLSDCPMGVYVDFYTVTQVRDTLTSFPLQGEEQEVYLMAFDGQGKLVYITQHRFSLANNQKIFVPIYQEGEYSFVAWSGEASSISLNNTSLGTPKEQILSRLKQDANGNVAGTQAYNVYQGSFKTHLPELGDRYQNSPSFGSNTVVFKDPLEYGSQFRHIQIGMKKITNRIKVTVEGGSSLLNDFSSLNFSIIGNNGEYLYDADFAPNSKKIVYQGNITKSGDDLLVDFPTIGKLDINQKLVFKITFVQPNGEHKSVEYDLIAFIRAHPEYSEEMFEWAKTYELFIKFNYNISVQGEVTNWTAVSRDVVLSV